MPELSLRSYHRKCTNWLSKLKPIAVNFNQIDSSWTWQDTNHIIHCLSFDLFWNFVMPSCQFAQYPPVSRWRWWWWRFYLQSRTTHLQNGHLLLLGFIQSLVSQICRRLSRAAFSGAWKPFHIWFSPGFNELWGLDAQHFCVTHIGIDGWSFKGWLKLF